MPLAPSGFEYIRPLDLVVQRIEPELGFPPRLLVKLLSQLGEFLREESPSPFREASFRSRSFRSGVCFTQSALPSSDVARNPLGPLCSADITPLHRSYGPLRLPAGPREGYGFPSGVGSDPPNRISQVPG
jgi:hypothetical protein